MKEGKSERSGMIVPNTLRMKTMNTKPRLEWKDASMTAAFHVNENPYIHTPPVFKIKGSNVKHDGITIQEASGGAR